MFHLSTIPLDPQELREGLMLQATGAFCSFEGWVRGRNRDKAVCALEYEVYDELCAGEAERIFREVYAQFEVQSAKCVHRVGTLKPGEMSVWVGVVAEHRDAAFKACRYIIDQVKSRLPIWKKEHYADGHSGWLASEPVTLHE